MTTAKAAATRCFCISASLWAFGSAVGCGSYADFTLPVLPAASQAKVPTIELAKEPVLSGSGDVLNPSVAVFRGLYYNLYSNFDNGTWRTSLALSEDGVQWRKAGVVLSPDRGAWEGSYIAANGSVLVVGDELWYWYQAGDRTGPRIGLARSTDGRSWQKDPAPVLDLGPYRSWDERAVADPFVFQKDGWFYLYYLGQNRAGQQQIGLARSRDGRRWQRLRGNPVIAIPLPGANSADENGLGEPAVWEQGGAYWMLYTGRDRRERRILTLMRSSDGVHWNGFWPAIRGTERWNSQVICDATILGNRIWFGGGDVPSPDENLHGQVGTGLIQ